MATYSFFLCRADGLPITLEVQDHPSDEAAARLARGILAGHPAADFVTIARGETTLGAYHRGGERAVVGPSESPASD
ncbi:hypothetical protein [Phenylobacterium sp.]|uniref:hypothetical protein n=1 Tax=Phenylobacterium sp. TaxID=1871053 RepID=UPI00356446D3